MVGSCAGTATAAIPPGARADPDGHGSMLDPASAPLRDLDRELALLVRRFRTASHLVAGGVRPEAIDDKTYRWWVNAHRVRWSRRMEDVATRVADTEDVELRKTRLRKPSR